MSDLTPPPDDELVSAYVDDEATPGERARVESDPRAMAAVEVMRRLRGEVAASPLPRPPAGAMDAALAAAMLVADEVLPGPGQPSPGDSTGPDPRAPVVDLASRRRGRGPGPLFLGLAAAAAFVVLLGFVLRTTGGKTDSTATAALSAAAPSSTSPAAEVAKGGGSNDDRSGSAQPNDGVDTESSPIAPPSVAPTTTTSRSAPVTSPPLTAATTTPGVVAEPEAFRGTDLGSIADADGLRDAVAAATGSSGGIATPTTTTADEVGGRPAAADQVDACDAAVRATDAEVGDLRFAATVRFAGQDAVVLLYAIRADVGNANGPDRLHTRAVGTCAALDVQTF